MKKNKKHFDYFGCLVDMSRFALQEAEFLKEILSNFQPENLKEQCNTMHKFEHECDLIKHQLTTALVREFLPPIDREDLFNLAHITDNLTDSVENLIIFLYMANVTTLRDDTQKFLDLTVQCCESTVKLLEEFPHFKKSEKLHEYLVLLNDLEEQGDTLYTEAVHRLSCDSSDLREIIEWRSIYKNFEKCFDASESIADNIESVVLKNA